MKKWMLSFCCTLTCLYSFSQSWFEIPALTQANELFQYGSTLYATGGGGEAMYFATSTDGGDTWQVDPLMGQTMDMGGPVAGMFLNDQLGFLGLQGSFRGEILRTEDGGANWESVFYSDIISGEYENTLIDNFEEGLQPFAMYRINDSVAIIDHYQGGQLIRTTDMGTTWTALFNNYFAAANKLQVLNDALLYYKDNDALFKSTDAGLNWTLVFLKPPNTLVDVYHFLDEQSGYVLVTGNEEVLAFKTENGGADWEQVSVFSDALEYSTDLFMENELDGWLVNGKDLFKTDDGGLSWDYHQSLSFYSIRFRQFGDDLYLVGRGVAKLDRDASGTVSQIAADVLLYPNPTTNGLYLEGVDHARRLTVTNPLGYPLLETEQIPPYLDLSDLPAGLYLLVFDYAAQRMVRKFLKVD